MRALVALLIVLRLGAAAACAQEIATPVPQGTEGHFCKDAGMDKAELVRRHDIFFCFRGHRRFPASLTIAVVGPKRDEVKRAVLAALAETKRATGFTEGTGSTPDILVVATARHPSSSELGAALTKQGFAIEPKLAGTLSTFDMPRSHEPYGLETGGYYGEDGTIHIDGYVPSDRLTTAQARSIAMRALGIGTMLIAPMTTLPNGDERWSEDPRTFVPARTHQP